MSKTNLMKRLSMSCAAGVLVAGLSGAGMVMPFDEAEAAVSDKSLRYYEKAERHVKKGDLNAAIIQLKNAIRSDANNVDARVRLAALYLKTGDLAGAEKEFKAALARGYDAAAVVPELAYVYTQQGKFQELLEDFQDVKLDGEPLAALLVYQAQAQFNLKRTREAEALLEKARKLAPQMAQITIVSSRFRAAEGDYPGAEALIDVALKAAPTNVEALMQKAELRRMAKDATAAIAFADKALAANPRRREPRVTRGLARAEMGDIDGVMADGDVLLELNREDPVGAFLKAWAYAEKGDIKSALQTLAGSQGADALLPALYLGASLHVRAGELEQARAKIGRYLAQNPTNARAQALSGAIYFQAENYDDAIEMLGPLYKADPANIGVVTLLAHAWERSGDQSKAAALFDEAINLSPDDESLQMRAAQAKIGSGDLASGMDDLVALIDSETGGARAATLVFLTQLRNKNFAEARVALERLEEINGTTAETENFRASVALADGDLETTEKHLRAALTLQEDYQAARLNLARVFRLQKNITGAQQEYEKLLELYKGYLPAITGLLAIAREQQDERAIMRYVDMATRENPLDEKAHMLRVNHFLTLNKPSRALIAARDFITAVPDSLEAYDALARAQVASGDTTSAAVTYQQLAVKVPKNALVRFRLAQVLIIEKRQTDAMFALERALLLDPTMNKARRQRIDLERQFHGQERALEMARKLFSAAPEGPRQLSGLGQTLIDLGQIEEGLGLIREVFEETRGKDELLVLYNAYDLADQHAKAVETLEAWVTDHPDAADLRLILFSRLIGMENWAGAIAQGEILHQADVADIIVLNNLAWLYEQVGRIEEAKSFAKSAVELAPEAADVVDTYGWILFEHGDAKEAEAMLAKAAGLVPARRDIQYRHAAALARIGKNDKAIEKLRDILAVKGTFPDRDAAAALLADLE